MAEAKKGLWGRMFGGDEPAAPSDAATPPEPHAAPPPQPA